MGFADITITETGLQSSKSWTDAKAISRRDDQTHAHVLASLNLLRQRDGEQLTLEDVKLIRTGFIDFPSLASLAFEETKRYRTRHDLVYFSIGYCRLLHSSIALGLKAISDRSKSVGRRGLQLLATSNSMFVIRSLEDRLSEIKDDAEKQDCLAAIEAISSQNHHLFLDRQFTIAARRPGRSYLKFKIFDEEGFERRYGGDWRFVMMEQNAKLKAMVADGDVI